MANKISTVRTYPLNGAVNFTITFEYLARKFVKVTLIGKDRKELVLNQDYRFTTKTQITTSRAWTAADDYHMIEIRRFTSASDRLVDFADGSILRAYDLNISQIQTLHVAEEARDLTADTIGVNNDGNLDARGRRIVNLSNAVDDRDAISFGQVKTMNQNSWQARNESLQFRNEAEWFRNQAEGFKNESGTNATNTYKWRNEAEWFRDEAERFKNTATQQATAAGNSASAAHQSEVNAANSATASANSATLAEQQADRAEREADKLGNWNALTGTVQDVVDKDVSWYGAHTAKEFHAVGANGFRLIQGGYGAFFRNDGELLHLLLTDKDSPLGGFNSLRPFNVNLSSGMPSFPQGGIFRNAVKVYRWSGPQLVIDGSTNQPSYILGQTDNRSSWFVGKANVNSAEVILHSYDLDTSIFLKSDHIAFNKPLKVNGGISAFAYAPPNPAIGEYLNATAVRSQLRDRGALSDPLGAYCGMYLQEHVGTDHAMILNLNGYGKDTNWQLYSNGKISTPLGDVMTSGSDVRIKDDFTKPLDGAGERIDAIGIVEYTEIATGERKRGWVAQQLDMIDPLYTYLTANAEGSLLNTNDRALLADVITELQALRQRVKELEG